MLLFAKIFSGVMIPLEEIKLREQLQNAPFDFTSLVIFLVFIFQDIDL